MRVALVWLVSVYGLACFSPQVRGIANDASSGSPEGGQDAPVDAEHPVPDGASTPDAPSAIATTGCGPISTAGDEDRDGVADAMDACPPSLESADTDTDGVAGICDRSARREHIACFEGFSAGAPAGWGVHGGSVTGGFVLLGTSDDSGVDTPVVLGDPSSMVLAMTFLAPAQLGQLFELALADDVGCQIVGPAQSAWSLVMFDLTQVGFSSSSPSLVLALDRRGADYTCSVYAGGALLATATAPVTGPLAQTTLGVFAARVRLESVLVIDAQ